MDTICSLLARDHARTDELFGHACAHVRAANWRVAALTVRDLRLTLERHLEVEEGIVFAAFDAMIGANPAPTAPLRAEHRKIQGVLLRLEQSQKDHDMAGFFKHAATLRILLQQHHEKEELVFYPVAERMLASQRDGILDALREAEAEAEAVAA